MEIDIVLINEKIAFEFQSTIEVAAAETVMFHYSIWSAVAQSKELQFDEYNVLDRPNLQLFQNPILIADPKNSKKRKMIEYGDAEGLKKLLTYVTNYLKYQTVRYRKKNGYVLQKTKNDTEGDIVRRNRDKLKQQQTQYYDKIKKSAIFTDFVRPVPDALRLVATKTSEFERRTGARHFTSGSKSSLDDMAFGGDLYRHMRDAPSKSEDKVEAPTYKRMGSQTKKTQKIPQSSSFKRRLGALRKQQTVQVESVMQQSTPHKNARSGVPSKSTLQDESFVRSKTRSSTTIRKAPLINPVVLKKKVESFPNPFLKK